eukprot:TRINITY_DN2624_c0_g1_i1.p1 TRINITY_DN2624_c0_g1~~TRINITY_DN2624_c0_g1_i1.p1  ORF type:complete len:149 (+),score=23.20 TRINITY_DN2624_c0_g1_i1:253-699(+)
MLRPAHYVAPSHACSSQAPAPKTFVWTLAAKKLHSSDMTLVSPRFELKSGSVVPFRVVLVPRLVGGQGGQVASLKESKGCASIQIKSELDVAQRLAFDLKLGSDFAQVSIEHDFGASHMCKLPGVWNFSKAVDIATQKIVITVTATPK